MEAHYPLMIKVFDHFIFIVALLKSILESCIHRQTTLVQIVLLYPIIKTTYGPR